MRKMRVLDLFSGIGGFSLGLEMAGGFETVAFCEIEPFARGVLRRHWPNVGIFEDVKSIGKEELDEIGKIDILCGGFPCQDISTAGRGGGIHAEKFGLWWEMLRIAGMARPRYVLVENVAALLARGADEVLGSLADIGYDSEWDIVRASEFGLPHERRRLYIVAYHMRERLSEDKGVRERHSPALRGVYRKMRNEMGGCAWRPRSIGHGGREECQDRMT